MSNAVDMGKLEQFLGKVVGDVGAALAGALVVLGDRLGLYKALAEAGPADARRAGRSAPATAERYVREWLNAQAAGGYVTYDADSGRFTLPPEQALALADETAPRSCRARSRCIAAWCDDEPKIDAAFRTGGGRRLARAHPCLFEGTERFFRPGYIGNLVSAWIPALDGVEAKLERGAQGRRRRLRPRRLDASSWRRRSRSRRSSASTTTPASIEAARQRGRGGRRRRSRDASRSPRRPTSPAPATISSRHFDCLHDMGDPVGAAQHVREALARTARG